MNQTVVDFFNSLSPFAIGSAIALITALGAFVIGILKGIRKFHDTYSAWVIENNEKKEDLEKMHKSIEEIYTSVQNINESIKTVSDNMVEVVSTVQQLEAESKEGDEKLANRIDDYEKSVASLSTRLKAISDKTDLIIESDKDSMKSYITDKYYECTHKGYIEIHTLETLEKTFKNYLDRNGNTFVSDLMEELRELPKDKPKNRDIKPTSEGRKI